MVGMSPMVVLNVHRMRQAAAYRHGRRPALAAEDTRPRQTPRDRGRSHGQIRAGFVGRTALARSRVTYECGSWRSMESGSSAPFTNPVRAWQERDPGLVSSTNQARKQAELMPRQAQDEPVS